ncbi:uncharacterized protein [Antedon mediterranea]|uniref:uncharacterized protein n=1 Tax=Antedon mediterranea TaxID=105859 RepID=UPI003AF5CC3D
MFTHHLMNGISHKVISNVKQQNVVGIFMTRKCVLSVSAVSNHRCRHTHSGFTSNQLLSYTPPDWAKHLKMSPSVQVQLFQPFTPIQKWNLPGVPSDIEVCIKRDDMTGCALSGNKIRKLEFLLAEALSNDCKAVITCGGVQSNHCRTTAVAARQLGLETHLLLRSRIKDPCELGSNGNMLLNRLMGASMYLVPIKAQEKTDLIPRMQQLTNKLKKSKGIKAYSIPIGGSNVTGLHGYLNGWQELLDQGVINRFDDIVLTVGSGGTAAGISIGNYLTGSHLRIHAFAVCDTAAYFHSHINETLDSIGIDTVRSEGIINIHEGAKGLGYGISKPEELEFIKTVAKESSILLDPTYTGKAALALTKELMRDRSKFKGRRILFLHSGGIFGMFDGQLGDTLTQSSGADPLVQNWMNPDGEPTIY